MVPKDGNSDDRRFRVDLYARLASSQQARHLSAFFGRSGTPAQRRPEKRTPRLFHNIAAITSKLFLEKETPQSSRAARGRRLPPEYEKRLGIYTSRNRERQGGRQISKRHHARFIW